MIGSLRGVLVAKQPPEILVDVGGIGYELKNAMSWGQGQYDESAAIFLLLFATIVTFDQVSSYFRDRLTHGRKQEMLA